MSAKSTVLPKAQAAGPKPRVRDRIFKTACGLFYRHGIRGVGVDTIAREVSHGRTPAELVSNRFWSYLTLAQVYAALAYYHAHKEEIDSDIEEDRWAYSEGAEEARRNGQGVRKKA